MKYGSDNTVISFFIFCILSLPFIQFTYAKDDIIANAPQTLEISNYLGMWFGEVDQPNYGKYPATMNLRDEDGVLTGDVNYPTLSCGGKMGGFNVNNEGGFTFTESISGGTCITGGIVNIDYVDVDTLYWQWFHPTSRKPLATATFKKKHTNGNTSSNDP